MNLKNISLKSEFDLMLNKGLNPAKLLLNIKEEMSQEDLIKSFKAYLEIENCFVLPVYNYHKLLKSKLDLNSVQYDPSNAFFNIFPSIENDDKKFAAKKLMEVLDTSNNNGIYNPYNNMSSSNKLNYLINEFRNYRENQEFLMNNYESRVRILEGKCNELKNNLKRMNATMNSIIDSQYSQNQAF